MLSQFTLSAAHVFAYCFTKVFIFNTIYTSFTVDFIFRENFERLLEDKTFKNEIVAFNLDEETSVIRVEHRSDLLPVLMR